MITITQAAPEDYPEVLRLVDCLLAELEDTPAEFAGLDHARTLRDLAAAGPRFAAYLARTPAGEAVGVLTLVETFAIYAGGNYGVIDEMYVAPAHRGQRVGAALIEAAKAHGRARGWRRLDVTAPPEARWARTVRFYEAQGFVFTGPKLRCDLQAPTPPPGA